jgi:DNA-binding response OmpR family regulator
VSVHAEKSILIVDNQQSEATNLRRQLEYAGFKAEVAHTGTGAINKIKDHLPDVVLLELGLSDIDALEVVSFIRNDSQNCLVPVIAMSAFPHLKDKSLRVGCNDFFQKPIKVLDLVVRIRKALR